LRYDFFRSIISGWKNGESFILTAHHADDNAETLLMNFSRGTGLHGLTGIPSRSGQVRRPLLTFSRKQIEQYASENNLSFVEDSSNSSDKYTRNHFRLNVIPSIREVYQTVTDNLNDNARRFLEIERLYDHAVGKIISKISRVRGNEIHIPVKQLMEYRNRALIFSIISKYGFSEGQVAEVEKLAQSESGHFINSTDGLYRIIRHRHWFVISPANTQQSEFLVIEEPGKKLIHDGREINFDITKTVRLDEAIKNKDSHIAFLDAKLIAFPLMMRRWKQGDYFYPLGMKKKKKLARFFIDQKLSKSAKENIWVIEMNRKIIWIVGLRIDDRFKITVSTSSVLKITSNPLI
jgi:tRNA(Ile)-lysidine synthase